MAINKTVNKQTKSHGAMKNCITYVLKEQKTAEGLVMVTGPFLPQNIAYDTVYQSFMEEKKLWNKDSGRMYAHNIISWHKDEKITQQEALAFGGEFAEKVFGDFQTLIAVHQDREHIHVHLVTNAVSFVDGHKLHMTKHDLEKMKQITNEMCQKRGLSIAEKGKDFYGNDIEEGQTTIWSKDLYNLLKNKPNESYLADCAIAVQKVRAQCISKEEFIQKMAERGWRVTWSDNRKYITFENAEGKKIRDKKLATTFNIGLSKEELSNEFTRNRGADRTDDGATRGRSNSGTDNRGAGGATEPITRTSATRREEELTTEVKGETRESGYGRVFEGGNRAQGKRNPEIKNEEQRSSGESESLKRRLDNKQYEVARRREQSEKKRKKIERGER